MPVELDFLLRDARIDLASGQDTLMLRRPGRDFFLDLIMKSWRRDEGKYKSSSLSL